MNRTATFIDIENLLGGKSEDFCALDHACEVIAQVRAPGGLLTVGMSHHFCATVGPEVTARFPGARLVLRSGENGADEALLQAIQDTRLSAGDAVVIVSGDAIFSERVAELEAAGISCTVVAHRNALGHALASAACATCFVDQLTGWTTEAVAA